LKKNILIYTLGSSLYALISTLLIPLFLKDLEVDAYGDLSIAFITVNLLIVFFGISIQNSVYRFSVKCDLSCSGLVVIGSMYCNVNQ